MSIDWGRLHASCVTIARKRGLSREDAEDAAQDAVLATWRVRPSPRDPEAYAMRCLMRARAQASGPEPIDVERIGVEPTQYESAVRAQQRFLVRVAVGGDVTLLPVRRSLGEGGAARVARFRLRQAVVALVGETR
jgi:hypothetical protein